MIHESFVAVGGDLVGESEPYDPAIKESSCCELGGVGISCGYQGYEAGDGVGDSHDGVVALSRFGECFDPVESYVRAFFFRNFEWL